MRTEIPPNPVRNLRWLYRIILPAITVVALLLVSSIIPRPLFLHSRTLDFLARLWLAFWLCAGYLIMSDLEKYQVWVYGRHVTDPNSENDGVTRLWNIAMAMMGGFFTAMITSWTLVNFLALPRDKNRR